VSSTPRNHERNSRKFSERDGSMRIPAAGEVIYESLYQVLPVPLAGRTFGALRIKLLPGLVKCRDPSGRLVERPAKPENAPQAAIGDSPIEIARQAPLSSADVSKKNVKGEHVTFKSSGRVGPHLAAASPFGAQSSQAAHRAISVLMEVLLAPVAPQARQAILGEMSASWRLPPSTATPTQPQLHSAAGRAPVAGSPGAATVTQHAAVERLAERCTGVYLTARRANVTEQR
jgi:hypothetical protein